MTVWQSVLFFLVWSPLSAVVAMNLGDTGFYRHRIDLDWPVTLFVFAWAEAAGVVVWSVIR